MLSCIVLYRGDALGKLKMVAMSSNKSIVSDFAERLLADPEHPGDYVLGAREEGIRKGLRRVRKETRGA